MVVWYFCTIIVAICCAYLHFVGNIIIHEIVPQEFLQKTAMLYPEEIYNELHFFDTMAALPEEAKEPMPTQSYETFMADMKYCIHQKHYWIMMFARAPLEALRFFCCIFQTIICYILINAGLPLHYFIDCSLHLVFLQELANKELPMFPLFNLWAQTIFISILTIWARSVGPRFRPDQLSEVTWKDIFVLLGGMLAIAITLIILI